MTKLEELIKELCPNGVEYKTVEELIKGRLLLIVTPSIKIKRNHYAVSGITPIISQEIEFISGYCDFIDENIPKDKYLCFGDHSEHIKFIDFSFVQGADGLKIIKNNCDYIDLKYIYYAVSNNYIRHDNYERHYKYFVATQIPLPPLAVQREIVRVLDSFTLLSAELTAELTARKKQYDFYRDKLLSFNLNIPKLTLTEIFNTRNGYTPSTNNKEFWNSKDVPWFRIEDIRENGRILNKAIQYVSFSALKGKPFPENSIIVSTSATIGEHALIACESLANQRFTYLMLKDEYKKKYNIKFLFYYCYILDEFCKNNLNQGSFAAVDMKKFNKFEFPLPPLDVQERIVNVLDNFDAICSDLGIGLPAEIEARQKQYEYYRDKLLTFDMSVTEKDGGGALISLFQYVFGFAFVRLGSLCYKTEKIKWSATNNDYQYIDLTSVNVDNHSIKMTTTINKKNAPSRAQQIVKTGDIIFGTTRPMQKRIAMINVDYDNQICSTGYCVVRVKNEFVLPKWIYFMLMSDKFYNYVEANQEGASYPCISDEKIRQYLIAVPPIEEQNRIVEILDRFDKLCNDISVGLPAEIEARQKQYEFYRDKLLIFKE